jgi:hypothetical protein
VKSSLAALDICMYVSMPPNTVLSKFKFIIDSFDVRTLAAQVMDRLTENDMDKIKKTGTITIDRAPPKLAMTSVST